MPDADRDRRPGVHDRRDRAQVVRAGAAEHASSTTRIKDGLGCDIPAAAEKAQGKPVPDEHLNEHATCFNLKDRGLIVISSCGHAGIVNSTRQAMKVSGVEKVHAIIGGFHLFPADDAYLRQTVAELDRAATRRDDPDALLGAGARARAARAMPEQFVPSTTGTEFTFGA